jgi:NitT/TauT family transport system permease protein
MTMAPLLKRLALPALPLVVLVAAWLTLTLGDALPSYVLPRPADMVAAFRSAFVSGTLYPHIWLTTCATLEGFALGCIAGLLFGAATAELRWIDMALSPVVFAVQSVPKIALAPLIIAYAGIDTGSKIATAAVLAFFPMFLNTATGLKSTDRDVLMLYEGYACSRWRVLWEARLPSALVYIFSGLQVAFVLALLGCIVSEFVASSGGLGFIIKQRMGQLDVAMMFVAIAVLALIGLSVSSLLLWLQKRLLFWEAGDRPGRMEAA